MNSLRSIFVGALFGVFAFALFTPGPLSKQRITAPSMDVINHVRASSVSIENPTGGQGSGVIFHRFGRNWILTAAHVVEDMPFHGEVKVWQNDSTWVGVVVCKDLDRDVALLRLDIDYLVGKSAEISLDTLPKVGTALLHVGNLLGRYPGSYTEGILSVVGARNGDFDQTTVLAYPGSSGGGIFTTDGLLVGILVCGDGPGLNWIVPARHLRQWAQANDTQWLFDAQ